MPRQDPLDIESALISQFDGLKRHKDILKLNSRIFSQAKDDATKMFCKSVAASKEPLQYLDFCRRRIADSRLIKSELIAAGNHGMLVFNRIVYGVKLDTRENWLTEDKEWTIEDEDEILDKAARRWMEEQNIKKFVGKVVLFPEFGFSGQMMLLDIQ